MHPMTRIETQVATDSLTTHTCYVSLFRRFPPPDIHKYNKSSVTIYKPCAAQRYSSSYILI